MEHESSSPTNSRRRMIMMITTTIPLPPPQPHPKKPRPMFIPPLTIESFYPMQFLQIRLQIDRPTLRRQKPPARKPNPRPPGRGSIPLRPFSCATQTFLCLCSIILPPSSGSTLPFFYHPAATPDTKARLLIQPGFTPSPPSPGDIVFCSQFPHVTREAPVTQLLALGALAFRDAVYPDG